MKRLIVNADDLGYDPEIDRGILEAHARGIVTSATAMVESPFAAAALRSAPASLGVGLHLVLDPQLRRGAAADAIRRQIDRFLLLRGAAPTHLDSHKHAHASPELLAAVAAVASEARLPVRALDPDMRARLRRAGVATADAFLGDAALRPCWTPERLRAAIAGVGEGTTEIMAHPGYAPARVRTSFGVEREVELAALCDPGVRALAAASGIALVRYDVLRADAGA